MSEDSITKFKSFNFSESADWQKYVGNILITSRTTTLEKVKRKWYKKHIDQNFDIEFDTKEAAYAEERQRVHDQARAGGNPYVNPAYRGLSKFMMAAVHIQGILWIMFLCSIPAKFHTFGIAIFAFVLGIYRELGAPTFSKQYFALVVMNHNMHGLFYCLIFEFMIPNRLVALVPLAITAVLGMADFFLFARNIAPIVTPMMQKVVAKRAVLKQNRGFLEIGMGFYFLIGIFIGSSNLFAALIFWQFLRLKYMCQDPDTVTGFAYVRMKGDALLASPNSPSILRTIWEKLKSLAFSMSDAQSGRGGCTIF
eukprot:CAMPEP_0115045930 /NCGR_PEP_ID=MMETSP0216-20121206/48463_1 /TAXON_ID=223996 /ORGANISM="Protocruzia adherens, Strain Boccale" /LENGTH=309 /DNA_ID=CAMNT_0002428947 /DNA_START=41 /DNA_END=970 /DNA_ORIENTATION=+